jgi:hypothetical protein
MYEPKELIMIHIQDPGRHAKWSGFRLAYSVRPFYVKGPKGSEIMRFRVTLKVAKQRKEFIFNSVKIIKAVKNG